MAQSGEGTQSTGRDSRRAGEPVNSDKKVVAYCNPWSVCAGEALDVMVSCLVPGDYTAELVQLVCGDSRPHGTGFREIPVTAEFAGSREGREQILTPGSYAVLPGIPECAQLSFCCYVYPTLLAREWQPLAWGSGLQIDIAGGRLGVRIGVGERLELPEPLRLKRWHRIVASFDSTSGRLALAADCRGIGAGEKHQPWQSQAITVEQTALEAGDWLLAAHKRGNEIVPGFNGRLEAPRLIAEVIDPPTAQALLDAEMPTERTLLGAWDFSADMSTTRLLDVSDAERHGYTVQTPTRAVKGSRWDGSTQHWPDDPIEFAAIHFHEDDLTDAGWEADFSFTVPDDLASSVYAIKLTLDGSEDYVPFYVRPAPGQARARVAFLASTATYLAYANQRLGFSGGIFGERGPRSPEDAFLLKHPEVGYSLYEYHADGSGVHFSSRLRPVLNMRPKTTPWSFNADTNIVSWLHDRGEPFDVITDEDLHQEGFALLEPYAVLITGTHPEYHSTKMLNALERWLEESGRLMYMGGNGFYWRIAYDPQNPAIIEVRRAEGGTRAWIAEPGEYYHAFTGEYGGLWRRLGRPPNTLVGVGFAAQGFDGGTYYRLAQGALDERVAFIMENVQNGDVIGNYGTQGGGAAGEEIDRFDTGLGSPAHAVVIASSENHRPGMLRVLEEFHMTQPDLQGSKVRADLVFFETPSGGAVFSTGSISYAGAIAHNGYDNDIARITNNVLERFLDPAPFDYPG